MFKAKVPAEEPFAVSLFGCQNIDLHTSSLVQAFDALIKGRRCARRGPGARHLGPRRGAREDLDRVLAVARRVPDVVHGPAVAAFWAALPDDAGWFREVFSLPAARVMFMTATHEPNGFAHLGDLVPLTEKFGYWGSYRERLNEGAPGDAFKSPLPRVRPRPPRACAAGGCA